MGLLGVPETSDDAGIPNGKLITSFFLSAPIMNILMAFMYFLVICKTFVPFSTSEADGFDRSIGSGMRKWLLCMVAVEIGNRQTKYNYH